MRKTLLLLSLAAFSLSACRFAGGKRIKGSGNITTKDVSTSGFTNVEQRGSFDVYLNNGPVTSVKIEAEDNLLQYIDIYVSDNTLEIKTKEGYNLRPSRDVKIFITSPKLTEIESSGSGNIISQSPLSDSDKMSFSVRGSADIKVDVNAPAIAADISGSGNMELKGQTKKFEGEVTGSGDIKAQDLKAEEVSVEIKGSGSADVFASVKLNVSVRGSGDVRYRGNAPQVVNDIKGSGSVSKVD